MKNIINRLQVLAKTGPTMPKMTFLRNQLDKVEKHFLDGGKLEKLHPLYDAIDTFLFVPGYKTENGPHVRDSIDLKRSMIFVVIALLPCLVTFAPPAAATNEEAVEQLKVLSPVPPVPHVSI